MSEMQEVGDLEREKMAGKVEVWGCETCGQIRVGNHVGICANGAPCEGISEIGDALCRCDCYALLKAKVLAQPCRCKKVKVESHGDPSGSFSSSSEMVECTRCFLLRILK